MDERDFEGEEVKSGEKVAETKKIWKVGELGDNPEFQITTTTSLDDDGVPVSEETAVVYRAEGCGHWVGYRGPHELGGQCSVCGSQLCDKCSLTSCSNCKTQPLCPSCSRVGRAAQEVAGPQGQVLKVTEEIYCPRCYRLLIAGRLIRSVFGGIHRFLSRDISNG